MRTILLLLGLIGLLYIIHSKINNEYVFIKNVIRIIMLALVAIFSVILISAIMGHSI